MPSRSTAISPRDSRPNSRPAQLTLHVADVLDFDFRALGPRAARRRQPAVQHQLAAALSPRAVRRATRRRPRDAAKGGGGADDGAARHCRIRTAHRDAAGAVPPDAPLRRAGRRVPAGAEDRFRGRAPGAVGGAKPHIADAALFGRLVSAAFGQRRKTLRNALSAMCDEGALRRAGIDPGARGETLTIADFVRLANVLATHLA